MIHCATCASIGRCEDAIRNGNLVRCPYFGDLSRQVAPKPTAQRKHAKIVNIITTRWWVMEGSIGE